MLYYSDHAIRQMRKRRITETEVSEALDFQVMEWPSGMDPTCSVIVGQTRGGRELKIIVNVVDSIIVTVAATRE